MDNVIAMNRIKEVIDDERVELLSKKLRTLEELYNQSILNHERLIKDLSDSQLRVIAMSNALNKIEEVFVVMRDSIGDKP